MGSAQSTPFALRRRDVQHGLEAMTQDWDNCTVAEVRADCICYVTSPRRAALGGMEEECEVRAPARPLMLAVELLDCEVAEHWGLAVGEDVYEMTATSVFTPYAVVVGPKGIVANASPDGTWLEPGMRNRSRTVDEFNLGYLVFNDVTYATDEEIVTFLQAWVQERPHYNVLTNNCQDLVVDMFAHLAGRPLPSLTVGKQGLATYIPGLSSWYLAMRSREDLGEWCPQHGPGLPCMG